jgi:hypothetical protein
VSGLKGTLVSAQLPVPVGCITIDAVFSYGGSAQYAFPSALDGSFGMALCWYGWTLVSCDRFMFSRFLIRLPLLVAALTVTNGRVASAEDCAVIDAILIETGDVYPDADRSWLESGVNFLHFRTREQVIRKELLLAPGECLNPELVEETARNLRALGIFADARIETEAAADSDGVVLRVLTRDQFTLRAEISASQNAGTTKRRLSLGDKNLFGLNKSFHFSQRESEDRMQSRYVYRDRRIVGDWAFYAQYEEALGGRLQSVSLSQPFRSLNDRFSWGGSFEHDDRNFT